MGKFIIFILHIIILFFFLSYTVATAQIVSISIARTNTEGDTVTIKGIITADEFGNQKYIQDNTSGIALYSTTIASLKKGDSVEIKGILKNYYGELELSPVIQFNLINTGNMLPQPKELQFNSGFSEQYEGQLVMFKDISFNTTGTFDAGTSGKNYIIIQSSVEKEIRVKPQTDLPGKTIPTGKVDIIGIMSHYKSGTTDKYQLYPRSFKDLIILKGPVIESGPVQSNLKTDGFTVSFTTREPGNTIIYYGLTKQLEFIPYNDKALKTEHIVDLMGLSPATFYYVQVASVKGNDTSFSGIYYYSTASLSKGKIIAYFNRPVNSSFASVSAAQYLNKSIDDTLVAYINRAEKSIDVAIYNLDNLNLSANISNALNDAHQRGVVVRIIGDGSTSNNGLKTISGPQVFKSPQGANYDIMHNKFIIFDAKHTNPDKSIVWTGSTNLTDNQIHTDPNNVIIIYDQAIAKAFTLEFEEMWGSTTAFPSSINSKFGKYKTENTPHHFKVGEKLVELYFSPSDQVNSKIINYLKTAEKDIYFGIYVMTRTEIANQIVYRHNDQVYTAGIIGDVSGSNNAAYNVMQPVLGDSLIKVYSKSGVFHHKYCIVDQSDDIFDPCVLTGSHNWSRSADESNDENTVIVHSKEVANWYLQEWAQRFIDEGGKVFIGYNKFVDNDFFAKIKCFIFENDLKISINSNVNEECKIAMYALDGKEVFNNIISLSAGNNQIQFKIPEVSNEIYILKIQSETRDTTIKLLKISR